MLLLLLSATVIQKLTLLDEIFESGHEDRSDDTNLSFRALVDQVVNEPDGHRLQLGVGVAAGAEEKVEDDLDAGGKLKLIFQMEI